MAKAGKRTCSSRYSGIGVGSFLVMLGVWDVVDHRTRMSGFDRFSTIFIIVGGVMCVFAELTALLREPNE